MSRRRQGGRAEAKDPLVRALGHPLRVEILRFMHEPGREAINPKGLAKALHRDLNLVSYHVRVLEECGAVKLVRTQPARGAMAHFYVFDIAEPWVLAMLRNVDPDGESGMPAGA